MIFIRVFVDLFNYVTQSLRFPLPKLRKTNNFLDNKHAKNHHISIHKKQPLRLFQTSPLWSAPQTKSPPCAPPSHLGPLSRRTRSTRGKRNPRPRVGSFISQCLLRRGPHATYSFAKCMFSWFVVSCEFAIHLYLISIWYNDITLSLSGIAVTLFHRDALTAHHPQGPSLGVNRNHAVRGKLHTWQLEKSNSAELGSIDLEMKVLQMTKMNELAWLSLAASAMVRKRAASHGPCSAASGKGQLTRDAMTEADVVSVFSRAISRSLSLIVASSVSISTCSWATLCSMSTLASACCWTCLATIWETSLWNSWTCPPSLHSCRLPELQPGQRPPPLQLGAGPFGRIDDKPRSRLSNNLTNWWCFVSLAGVGPRLESWAHW